MSRHTHSLADDIQVSAASLGKRCGCEAHAHGWLSFHLVFPSTQESSLECEYQKRCLGAADSSLLSSL